MSADDVETEALVEQRRLEAVSVQHYLTASAGDRRFLGGLHQGSAVSMIPVVIAHPEIANLAASAPSPAVEPCDDGAVLVAHEVGEDFAVRDAGPLDVVLVDTI